jgi:hypothetical protein
MLHKVMKSALAFTFYSAARPLAFCLAATATTTEIALFVRLQFLYNIHESRAPLL